MMTIPAAATRPAMTAILMTALEGDAIAHLAIALRRHRNDLRKTGVAEPPGLAELEQLAVSLIKRQESSDAITVPAPVDDGANAKSREYLSRAEAAHLIGVSIPTIDRWIASEKLHSSQLGRVRRIKRSDISELLDRPGDQRGSRAR